MQVVFHADNHIQDTARDDLHEQAAKEEIVLLLEGLEHGPLQHGVTGLNQLCSPQREWATAARYATGQGAHLVGIKMKDIPGVEGKITIRAVANVCACLSPKVRTEVLPVDMARFSGALADLLRNTPNSLRLRQEAANTVARSIGKWPCKDYTFSMFVELLTEIMPFFGLQGNVLETMNRIVYLDREAEWAACISKYVGEKPVHVIVGAVHLAGLLTDRQLAELRTDVVGIRTHQANLKGQRLWEQLGNFNITVAC